MIDTLALWRRSRFVWGETDCILSVCNHIRDVTGVDPAMPWRGTYHDREGAEGIFSAYGGVLALFGHGMALAGFHSAREPQAGWPVVCRVAGHEVAGLYLGPRVAFMAEGRGCVEMRAEILGAWRI